MLDKKKNGYYELRNSKIVVFAKRASVRQTPFLQIGPHIQFWQLVLVGISLTTNFCAAVISWFIHKFNVDSEQRQYFPSSYKLDRWEIYMKTWKFLPLYYEEPSSASSLLLVFYIIFALKIIVFLHFEQIFIIILKWWYLRPKRAVCVEYCI